jgi:electron transfer flavoprotein beta subunit
MIIACLVKPVPDPEYYNRITIDPERGTLNRAGIPVIMNPSDRRALEEAIRIKEREGGKVTVFSMAPDDTESILRECIAMGADDAFLLSDRAFAGADTLATSYVLAKALERFGPFDLVLAGNESADGSTSQVPSQVGVWLSLPALTGVVRVEHGEDTTAWCDSEGGRVVYEVKLPAVLAVKREINEPRYTSFAGIIRAKKAEIRVIRAGDMELDAERIGLRGSPTRAIRTVVLDICRKGEYVEGSTEEVVERMIDELRKAGAVKE